MPTRKVKTKFWCFRQNNSGGSFVVRPKDGIGKYVVIEATSVKDANERALSIGLYFDGCETGEDCSCCGDRWHSLWNDDKGFNKPAFYEEGDIKNGKYQSDLFFSALSAPGFIHYLDGRVKKVTEVKKGR